MRAGDIVRFPTYFGSMPPGPDGARWPDFETGIVLDPCDADAPDSIEGPLVFIFSRGYTWNRYRSEVEVISG